MRRGVTFNVFLCQLLLHALMSLPILITIVRAHFARKISYM